MSTSSWCLDIWDYSCCYQCWVVEDFVYIASTWCVLGCVLSGVVDHIGFVHVLSLFLSVVSRIKIESLGSSVLLCWFIDFFSGFIRL